jgi:hypothetical protein
MKKVLYYSLAALAGNLSLFSGAHAVTISMSIPGTTPNSSTTSPGAFVANFYQFALMIGGILAFGVIVYGGVKYMAAAGNPSGQSDAKEWIQAALLGLLLLIGAYFVLNVINPQLLNLTLPTLTPVNIQSAPPSTAPATSVACGSIDAYGNSQSGTCTAGNCCSTKDNNTGFVTYSCKATAC